MNDKIIKQPDFFDDLKAFILFIFRKKISLLLSIILGCLITLFLFYWTSNLQVTYEETYSYKPITTPINLVSEDTANLVNEKTDPSFSIIFNAQNFLFESFTLSMLEETNKTVFNDNLMTVNNSLDGHIGNFYLSSKKIEDRDLFENIISSANKSTISIFNNQIESIKKRIKSQVDLNIFYFFLQEIRILTQTLSDINIYIEEFNLINDYLNKENIDLSKNLEMNKDGSINYNSIDINHLENLYRIIADSIQHIDQKILMDKTYKTNFINIDSLDKAYKIVSQDEFEGYYDNFSETTIKRLRSKIYKYLQPSSKFEIDFLKNIKEEIKESNFVGAFIYIEDFCSKKNDEFYGKQYCEAVLNDINIKSLFTDSFLSNIRASNLKKCDLNNNFFSDYKNVYKDYFINEVNCQKGYFLEEDNVISNLNNTLESVGFFSGEFQSVELVNRHSQVRTVRYSLLKFLILGGFFGFFIGLIAIYIKDVIDNSEKNI